MTTTQDLPDRDLCLARGVAERLGVLTEARPESQPSVVLEMLQVSDVRVEFFPWLYSPEGAFWLLEQIDQRGLEVQVPFERALYQRVSWVWKLTPEAILRAAAQALGVRE